MEPQNGQAGVEKTASENGLAMHDEKPPLTPAERKKLSAAMSMLAKRSNYKLTSKQVEARRKNARKATRARLKKRAQIVSKAA